MACVGAPKRDGQQVEEGTSLPGLYKTCLYICNNQVSMHIAGLSLQLAYLDTKNSDQYCSVQVFVPLLHL